MKDVEELDRATRDMIAQGRHALDPDSAIRERVRQRVLLELAGSGAAATAARPALAKASTWLLATAMVGGMAAGVRYFNRADAPAPRSTAAVVVTSSSVPLTPAPATSLDAAPSASTTGETSKPTSPRLIPSASPGSATSTASKRNDLGREVELLAATNAALNRGDASRARKLLGEYDRTFPNGLLQQERAAAEVLLLCASGDRSRSSAAVARFASRWPRSPLKPRIERACGGAK